MMPSFRQKVVGFLRQLSNQSENNRTFEDDHKPSSSDCFIQRYLSGYVFYTVQLYCLKNVSYSESKIILVT